MGSLQTGSYRENKKVRMYMYYAYILMYNILYEFFIHKQTQELSSYYFLSRYFSQRFLYFSPITA